MEFPIRLNKFLAEQTGISRREADELIEKGRIIVNGTPAILGTRINQSDQVKKDGKIVPVSPKKFTYIALNKPAGYVCSRKQQGDTPTIYSLLPEEYRTLKPVGRLDKDSSGLLLLTDDGDFAHRMTHPKFRKLKVYEVEIDKELEPLHQQMISDYGIQLDDGRSQLQLERLSDDNRKAWRVTMSEGRNRQIRRTFAALGYTVTRLHRVQFGDYLLTTLETGTYEPTRA